MEFKTRKPLLRFAPAKAGFALAGLLPLLVAVQAQAVEFSFADDEVTGSVDSTVSYGQLWRVQGQSKTNDDINANDGNRNFDTGLVSEVFKITTDAEAKYKNYGAFVRGTAFYDTQIMDKRNDYYDNNNPNQPSQSSEQGTKSGDRFTNDTRSKAGNNAEILDAYVYGSWDVAEKPVSARLGKQVFNWGEGLFYRGGVNTTNPIDAAKFRLPGSELKEVLIPVEALNFSVGLTDNLSMETFYQFNWKETAIDPVGTYFSETDLFADGGNTAYRDFAGTAAVPLIPAYTAIGNGQGPLGALLPAAKAAGLYQQGVNYSSGTILRVAEITDDENARNDGQFGASFKYIAEELNSTEFGAYFVNYHSKEPVIGANLNGYTGVNISSLSSVIGAAAARGAATIDVLGAVRANRIYTEDIRMLGLSFNTTVDETSVFGELAYRPNNPIGIATTNDLVGDLILQGSQIADNSGSSGVNSGTALLGGTRYNRNGDVRNYVRVETFNTSLGAIQNFGPALSFDSLFGVAELASEHYRGNDLQYTAYDGSNRYFSGRSNSAYLSGYDRDSQINKDAYGYTLLLNGTWNDVYAGVNLSPYTVYKSDFTGNSSQTGNFIEGRQAATFGLRASYLSSLEGELAYTTFWGAGQDNSGRDRDNVGVNVKYSF
ncbi:MAG: DUF1302 domain-containing protein [Pseudomonadaceae bacterium]|nr:DUF1302 domain-containing protein [Pseudomonadaceae bacterium]